MGTLSKAYGCIGGFVATEAYLAQILRFGCSAFGFTSTTAGSGRGRARAIDMVTDEPERRSTLWDNQRYFVSRMHARGLAVLSSATPDCAVRMGDERECVRVASGLREAASTSIRSCFRRLRRDRAVCVS